MAGLPLGWEWDYDGTRWFYKYKPTGHIQYHFPSEGDEFPDFVDAAEPAPVLAPEERLESQQQVKRQTTISGSQKSRASLSPDSASNGARPGMTATGGPVSAVWEPDGENEENVFQPENFMFLGPGTYADVSPLNEDEDEAAKRSVVGIGQRVGGVAGNKVVSPAESSIGTPMAQKSEPAQSPEPTEATVRAEIPHEADEQEAAQESAQTSQEEQTCENTDNEIPAGEHQAEQQRFDPVGFMAEMATGDTAMAHIERHPDPVEIGDNTVLAPIETAVPYDLAELPERNSPVERQRGSAASGAATQEETKEAEKTEQPVEPSTTDDATDKATATAPESSTSPVSSMKAEATENNAAQSNFKIKRKPTVLAEAAGSVAYRPYKPTSASQQAAPSANQPKEASPGTPAETQISTSEAQNTAAAPVGAQGNHWAAAAVPSADLRLEHMPSVLKTANRRPMQVVPSPEQNHAEENASKTENQTQTATHSPVLNPARNSVSQAPPISPKIAPQSESSPSSMQPQSQPQYMPASPSGSNPERKQGPTKPVTHQQAPPMQTPSIPGPMERHAMQQQQPASSPAPGRMPPGPVPIHTSTGPGPQYPPVAVPVAYNQYRASHGAAPPQPMPLPWIPPGQHGPPMHNMGQPQPGQMHPPGWVPSMNPGYGPAPVQQRPIQQGSVPQHPMQQPNMQQPPPQKPLTQQVPPAQVYASFASTPYQPPARIMRPQSVIGTGCSTQQNQQPVASTSDPTPPPQGPRRSSTMESSNVSPLKPRTESQSSGYPISSPSPMEQPLSLSKRPSDDASARVSQVSQAQAGNQTGSATTTQNQTPQSSYFSSPTENSTENQKSEDEPSGGSMNNTTPSFSPSVTDAEGPAPSTGSDEETQTGHNGTALSARSSNVLGRIEEHDSETISISNNSIQASNRQSLNSSIQHSPTPSRQSLPLSQAASNIGQSIMPQPPASQTMQPPTAPMPHGVPPPQGAASPAPPTPSDQARPIMPPHGMAQQSGGSGPMQQGIQGVPRPITTTPPMQGPSAKDKDNKWTKWFKSSKSTKKPPQAQQPGQSLPSQQAQPGWNGQWQQHQQPGFAPQGHVMPGNPRLAYPPTQFAPAPGSSAMPQLPPGMQPQGQPPMPNYQQQMLSGSPQTLYAPPGQPFQPIPQHMMQPGPGAPMNTNSNRMGAPPGQMMQPTSPAPSQGHGNQHSNSASINSMMSFQTHGPQQPSARPLPAQDPNPMPAPLSLGAKPGSLPSVGPPSGGQPEATAPVMQNGQGGFYKGAGQGTDYSGAGYGSDDGKT